MPTPTGAAVFLGEADGARVLRYGVGATDADVDGHPLAVRLELETWEARPAAECVYRQVDLLHRCTAGAVYDLTPIVDGVALPTQRVTRTGSGTFRESIYLAQRGSALAVRVLNVSRGGDAQVDDVRYHFLALRDSP